MSICLQDSGPDRLPSFAGSLAAAGKNLVRSQTCTLQVNLGFLCNQACRHCHLEAGPGRSETMADDTVEAVLALAGRHPFSLIDITGGAPEMHPRLDFLLARAVELAPRVMLRSNLTALALRHKRALLTALVAQGIGITVSLPAIDQNQTDSQRGAGVFVASIDMLKRLNDLGYGQEKSGLELNLVANPAGAFLPPPQEEAERRCRLLLRERHGIVFNRLFVFANVPLGRFRRWLELSGNYQPYMARLAAAFNPAAVDGVMCRSLVSVAWDGHLYDCDFNQAAGLPLGGRQRRIDTLRNLPAEGSAIAYGDHCYTCTAGAGFT